MSTAPKGGSDSHRKAVLVDIARPEVVREQKHRGPWLSIQGAAEYLGISRTTLYRFIQNGQLRADGRVGRSLRFHEASLDAFIRARNPFESGCLAGEEIAYATQAATAQGNKGARNLAQRRRDVSGSNQLERSKNRQTKAARADSGNDGTGTRYAGRTPRRRKETIKGEVARLRDTLGS